MIFLADILKELTDYEIRDESHESDYPIPIAGITSDSREVRPGFIFVAIPGFKVDGKNFIAAAVEKGAAAVVFEKKQKFFDKLRVIQIRVSGARLAYARLSCAFYAHPTEAFYLAGVTGTNGKTTLTYLLEALWQTAGQKTGVIGTVNSRFADTILAARDNVPNQTTPESRDLQRLFSEMKLAETARVGMEVSSHGIDLKRVEGCAFDSCVFTNLSQDHLDYHKTLEDYYLAKERLFTDHLLTSPKKNKLAVICTQDRWGKRLLKNLRGKVGARHAVPLLSLCSYGFDRKNDLYPVSLKMGFDGFKMVLKRRGEEIKLEGPLIGSFSLLNTLAVLEVGFHSGLDEDQIRKGLAGFRGVPGRLERVSDSKGRTIFIDYAHTPEALKNVVMTLRELTKKKIITVFGCGGDRDKSKRPKMGYQAARYSDICIVTSDNPRTEEPEKIIQGILPGIRRAKKKCFVEPDRKTAIIKALKMAKKGDLVLIAGKGHEDYQIVGEEKFPFSDRKVVEELVSSCRT